MSAPFPILKVAAAMRGDVEQLGSKPKFWFKFQGENWLFKEARKNTGEDWSEKVASEVASLLGLPTHHADLAVWEGRRGCAVKSFVKSNQIVLIHGNELLAGLITGYDEAQVRGQADHTFDNIVAVLEKLFDSEKARRTAASRMAGYVVLDALIGNTDRHHQNWGVLLEQKVMPGQQTTYLPQVAPTFDHASSLGRELSDEVRERHMREKTMERYIRKGRGGIFENTQSKHGMSPMALARMAAQRYPDFFKPWQTRIADLPEAALVDLLRRVPDARISIAGREFALSLLATSRKMIMEAP